MNSLPPLSLPRFHVNKLSQAHREQSASAQTTSAEDGFDMPEDEMPAPEPEPIEEPVIAPEPMAAPLPPEIDTGLILNRLEEALSGVEQSALAQGRQMVAEFLRAAFPRLVEGVLAEEVTAAIAAMAPNEVEKLILTVPPAFEASFQQAVRASPKYAEKSEVMTHTESEEIRVDVDWATGGLQFDMSQFLESSLGRLTGPGQTYEGQNV